MDKQLNPIANKVIALFISIYFNIKVTIMQIQIARLTPIKVALVISSTLLFDYFVCEFSNSSTKKPKISANFKIELTSGQDKFLSHFDAALSVHSFSMPKYFV